MSSPNRSPANFYEYEYHYQGSGGTTKHGEILNVLRNSPKGQLRYDTGWDEKPYAVAHLISKTQADEDSIKIAVIERVIRVTKRSEEKQALRDCCDEISGMGTSSGSGSRATLSENGYQRRPVTNNNKICVYEDATDSIISKKESKPRRKGYGIREDEYDDEAMERDFQQQQGADHFNHIESLIRYYNECLNQKALENSEKRKEKIFTELNEGLEKLNVSLENPEAKFAETRAKHSLRIIELEAQCMADVEAQEVIWKNENDALDREFELKKSQKRKQKAQENAAVQARLASAKAAEERERQIKIQQENDATTAAEAVKAKLLEAAAVLKSQQDLKLAEELSAKEADATRIKAESERQKDTDASISLLPTALQGFILKEDCDKYLQCSNLILSYEQATKDISAGSENPTIKKFYSAASKCINTPLNAVANTDPGQISAKITHFMDMIDGKPVYASSTMTTPFSAAALPNGKVFVMRLLAFRFVKKAESEILSEKKGFVPLASIALSLSKKFPEWGTLVQAYFYKLCPFLVPFNLPRGGQNLQEYCDSLGYDLKGSDSTLLNEMLGRIKGYCSLYAIMIQIFERSGQQVDIGEASGFFTIGGVWEILTKTMKLEPQPDVTVMVYQTLLELLSDRLNQVYGAQFHKFMNVLISVFLPKINEISLGASQSGVVRFTTFLQQFRRR